MGKKLVEVFLIALIVASVAGIFIKVVGALPVSVAQTTTNKQTTFDGYGEGKVSVAPDRAELALGVRKSASTVGEAQAAANETMEELIAELKRLSVKEEEIATTNYDIYPDYSSKDNRPSGYVVSSQVRVKVSDFDKISAILDLSGKLGLETVGQLGFGLSDEAREKAVEQAREKAVSQAKTKAESLAKLAGVRLGRVLNVQESSGGSYPVPMMYKADVASAPARAEAQVNPGTSEVVVGVTISYETY